MTVCLKVKKKIVRPQIGTITPNILVEEISPIKFMKRFLILKNWVTFCCSMWVLAEMSIKLQTLLLSLLSPPKQELDASFIGMLKTMEVIAMNTSAFHFDVVIMVLKKALFPGISFLNTPQSSCVALCLRAQLD